jgi:hypothetical protein
MSILLFWEKWLPSPHGDDIADALRCEVRDGLWLLARQWQLGEFKAEDAGTAAAAHIVAHASPLQRLAPPVGTPQTLGDEIPLNATVERVTPAFDLTWRLESGREWKRLLLTAGKTTAWEVFRRHPLLHFQTRELAYDPEDPELPFLDHEPYAQLLAAVAHGRMVDGGRLFEQFSERKASEFLSQPDPEVDALGAKWLTWVRQRLSLAAEGQIDTPANCWDAGRLEYRFDSAAADINGTGQRLKTPEHHGQSLDWFGFELSDLDNSNLTQNLDSNKVTHHHHTFIPALVSFPGMPRARWWEIEDSTIDLSRVQAANTDTGVLLLSEFSLLFSNDWLIVPLPVPVGSLVKLRPLKITDVFGVQSVVKSIYTPGQANPWELFQSNATGTTTDWLFVPPVNNRWLQSQPVEEVHFVRDEMANMVWAVEKTIPDGTGGGTEGQSAAIHFEDRLRKLAEAPIIPPPALQENAATRRYVVGTTVPPNWIPFLPVRPDPSKPAMVLRRAAMPRLIDGHTPTRIRPRTHLLRTSANNGNRYDVQEEEIPVTGITLRAIWRRARGFDGRTVTWLAYEKLLGRHLTGSGLQFDQAVDK